ncbi:MAG: metallophosphoesterase family protein [Gammaproteobacteria bacterium]|nr:metallophosphoesterase family protein [Gammaproteobacteria bacterium]
MRYEIVDEKEKEEKIKVDSHDLEKTIKELEKEKSILKHQIQDLNKRKSIQHYFSGKKIRIGIISDTHKGSLYANQHLEDSLINYFNKNKVDAIYHIGDLCDGEKMYRGHEYEIEMHGADKQVKHCVETFPKVDSKMYFITGNHDLSFWKNAGVDIGFQIAKERNDLEYLGQEQAIIEIKPKIKLMLMHPGGGTSYAVSYKSQKLIESFTGGEKPNLLLIGHFHKYDHLFYRNIHAFQCPTTQSQTPFMKRKPTPSIMGGLLLDIYIDKKGINKIRSEYLPYYEK